MSDRWEERVRVLIRGDEDRLAQLCDTLIEPRNCFESVVVSLSEMNSAIIEMEDVDDAHVKGLIALKSGADPFRIDQIAVSRPVEQGHLDMWHAPHDPGIISRDLGLHDRTQHARIEDRAVGRVEIREAHRTRIAPDRLIRIDKFTRLPASRGFGVGSDYAFVPDFRVAGKSRRSCQERAQHHGVVRVDAEARRLGSRQSDRVAGGPR